MNKLRKKHCLPCNIISSSLDLKSIDEQMKKIDSSWRVEDDHCIVRSFKFKDFKKALAFTNEIGECAETEDHHPDILLSYGNVEVKIYTHKVNGLTENDFFLASKIDQLTKI